MKLKIGKIKIFNNLVHLKKILNKINYNKIQSKIVQIWIKMKNLNIKYQCCQNNFNLKKHPEIYMIQIYSKIKYIIYNLLTKTKIEKWVICLMIMEN
jgi:hypothetical protein